MDPSLELMRQLEDLNGCDAMQIPNLGLMGCLNEDYLSHHYNLYSCSDHLLGSLSAVDQCQPRGAPPQPMASVSVAELAQGGRKRKGVEPACDDPSNGRFPDAARLAPLLTSAKLKNKNSPASGKRARGNSMEAEKPKEVVHVRARRGQATDSHSLAERSRRERINERMRCLQDLVPGCYKTMAMAGMLDEIINYVQSLQNQVEFLSLKLSAASSFYGCCFDMDTIARPQGGSEQDAARLLRMEYGACTSFSSTVPHHL